MVKKKEEKVLESSSSSSRVKMNVYQAFRRGLITRMQYEGLLQKKRNQVIIELDNVKNIDIEG